jgi:hypothetical protein
MSDRITAELAPPVPLRDGSSVFIRPVRAPDKPRGCSVVRPCLASMNRVLLGADPALLCSTCCSRPP